MAAGVVLFCCNAPTDAGLYVPFGGAAGEGQAGQAGRGGDGGGGAGAVLPDAGAGPRGGEGGGQPGAGAGGASLDAGGDAAADASDAAWDAASPCSGTWLDEICWYLGDEGESCSQTCAAHGGFEDTSTARIGSLSQGGSLAGCEAVLAALTGQEAPASQGTNTVGVGCHLFGEGQDRWWLESPDFSADATLGSARLACGCRE